MPTLMLKCTTSVPGASYEPKLIPHFAVYIKFSANNRQLLVLKVFRALMLWDITFVSLLAFYLYRVLEKYRIAERFDMYYARLRANRRKINIYLHSAKCHIKTSSSDLIWKGRIHCLRFIFFTFSVWELINLVVCHEGKMYFSYVLYTVDSPLILFINVTISKSIDYCEPKSPWTKNKWTWENKDACINRRTEETRKLETVSRIQCHTRSWFSRTL